MRERRILFQVTKGILTSAYLIVFIMPGSKDTTGRSKTWLTPEASVFFRKITFGEYSRFLSLSKWIKHVFFFFFYDQGEIMIKT